MTPLVSNLYNTQKIQKSSLELTSAQFFQFLVNGESSTYQQALAKSRKAQFARSPKKLFTASAPRRLQSLHPHMWLGPLGPLGQLGTGSKAGPHHEISWEFGPKSGRNAKFMILMVEFLSCCFL